MIVLYCLTHDYKTPLHLSTKHSRPEDHHPETHSDLRPSQRGTAPASLHTCSCRMQEQPPDAAGAHRLVLHSRATPYGISSPEQDRKSTRLNSSHANIS